MYSDSYLQVPDGSPYLLISVYKDKFCIIETTCPFTLLTYLVLPITNAVSDEFVVDHTTPHLPFVQTAFINIKYKHSVGQLNICQHMVSRLSKPVPRLKTSLDVFSSESSLGEPFSVTIGISQAGNLCLNLPHFYLT